MIQVQWSHVIKSKYFLNKVKIWSKKVVISVIILIITFSHGKENTMISKTTGKLIVTSYNSEKHHKSNTLHQVACFFAENKLEYVKVIPPENTLPVGGIVTGKVLNVVPNSPAAFIALNQKKEMGFLGLNGVEQAVVTNR